MGGNQLNLGIEIFNKFTDSEKFYSIKILEELYIKDELYTEEIYLIFNNKKRNSIRSILKKLEGSLMIQSTPSLDDPNKKIYSLTKSGESLIDIFYSKYPYIE